MDPSFLSHLEDIVEDSNRLLKDYPRETHQNLHDIVFNMEILLMVLRHEFGTPLVYHKPHNSKKTQ